MLQTTSLLMCVPTGEVSGEPPVATMNWRIPRRGSGRPSASCGRKRSYKWSWAEITTSASKSYKTRHSDRVAGLSPLRPDVNSGWCQYASVHGDGLAESSCRSHCSCDEPAPIDTLLLSE